MLFDYEPEQDDEIALTPGDVILVYDQDESGWWTGEIGDQYGLFPGAFVEFLENEEENYDFLKSTGDAEEERVIQELVKPERTLSSTTVATSSDVDLLQAKVAASEESRAALQAQVDQLKAAAESVPVPQETELLRQQAEEIAALRAERDRLAQASRRTLQS